MNVRTLAAPLLIAGCQAGCQINVPEGPEEAYCQTAADCPSGQQCLSLQAGARRCVELLPAEDAFLVTLLGAGMGRSDAAGPPVKDAAVPPVKDAGLALDAADAEDPTDRRGDSGVADAEADAPGPCAESVNSSLCNVSGLEAYVFVWFNPVLDLCGLSCGDVCASRELRCELAYPATLRACVVETFAPFACDDETTPAVCVCLAGGP